MLVSLWASYENGGSVSKTLGKATIFGMFFYGFGYGGFVCTPAALHFPEQRESQ